jgi:hypothetical protein
MHDARLPLRPEADIAHLLKLVWFTLISAAMDIDEDPLLHRV